MIAVSLNPPKSLPWGQEFPPVSSEDDPFLGSPQVAFSLQTMLIDTAMSYWGVLSVNVCIYYYLLNYSELYNLVMLKEQNHSVTVLQGI